MADKSHPLSFRGFMDRTAAITDSLMAVIIAICVFNACQAFL